MGVIFSRVNLVKFIVGENVIEVSRKRIFGSQ
ncbi:hypothetical protein M2273_003485 [Mucilaginibacter lappiensis]